MASLSRKSIYSTLCSLLKDTGIEIRRHVHISGYFVDIELRGCIHPTIIEYDENNHKYYDKKQEEQRELFLKRFGYNVVRVDDSIDPVESSAQIFKTLLSQIV